MHEINKDLKKPQQTNDTPVKFAFDILWVAFSQIITSLLGLIIIPALTKSYNSETYGLWIQVSVTVTLIVPVLTLGFGAATVRFLAGEDDGVARRRSLGTMLSAIAVVVGLAMIVVNIFASQFSVFLFDSPSFTYLVRLTIIWIVVDALFSFYISYMRARRRIKGLSIIQTFFSAAKLAGIVIVAKIGLPLQWIVVSMIFIELIFVIAVVFIIVREEGFPTPNFAGIKIFLEFSIPQIFSGFLLWIISASDRYLITYFLGLASTGLYSSSNAIASIIGLFYTPINFVLYPTISKAWEQQRKSDVREYLEYSTKLFLILAIPAVGGVTVLSQPLLKILATSEYLIGWDVVLFVAVGTLFQGVYLNNLYIIYLIKQTKWLPLMIIIASGASIGINLLLIPRMGIVGAAIANMIAYFILAMIVTFWARKIINYAFDFKFYGKIVAATLVMTLIIKLMNLNGLLGIGLAVIIGFAIFFGLLILFRTFSKQDKRLFRETATGIFSKLHKRNPG